MYFKGEGINALEGVIIQTKNEILKKIDLIREEIKVVEEAKKMLDTYEYKYEQRSTIIPSDTDGWGFTFQGFKV